METALFIVATVAALAGVVRAVVAVLAELRNRKRAEPAFTIDVRRFLERLAVVLERRQVQLVVRVGLPA